MSNMYLDCGLDSRLAWQKFKIENEQHSFLELLVNKFMQMFVESDDPNKGSVVLYWLLMKYRWSHADLSPNHLLCPKTFKWHFLFLETFVHVLDKHINANTWDAKQKFADFVLLITQISFSVIPKVCVSKCVFHFLYLEYLLRSFTLECGLIFPNSGWLLSLGQNPLKGILLKSILCPLRLSTCKRC